MVTRSHRYQTLDDLRDYVNQILCQFEQLELGAFQLTERLLVRRETPCGMFFCLHGPRSVKITAVWDAAQNTVMFYAPTGERFQTTQLTESPAL